MEPSCCLHLNSFLPSLSRFRRASLSKHSGTLWVRNRTIPELQTLSAATLAGFFGCLYWLRFAVLSEDCHRGVSFSTELRAISTARLSMSPCLHLRPIDVVVCDGPLRDLILKLASCLDAFSTYPTQTLLPGSAPGGTTGSQEVCHICPNNFIRQIAK